jgi:hypothetical protein
MADGFVPSQFTFPIRVKITAITGTSFTQSDICPAAQPETSSYSNNPAWVSASSFDIGLFMTLTEMQDLRTVAGPTTSGASAMHSVVPVLLPLVAVMAMRRAW